VSSISRTTTLASASSCSKFPYLFREAPPGPLATEFDPRTSPAGACGRPPGTGKGHAQQPPARRAARVGGEGMSSPDGQVSEIAGRTLRPWPIGIPTTSQRTITPRQGGSSAGGLGRAQGAPLTPRDRALPGRRDAERPPLCRGGKDPLEVFEHMFYNLDAGLEEEASGRHPCTGAEPWLSTAVRGFMLTFDSQVEAYFCRRFEGGRPLGCCVRASSSDNRADGG
jgi:hypothetical protein